MLTLCNGVAPGLFNRLRDGTPIAATIVADAHGTPVVQPENGRSQSVTEPQNAVIGATGIIALRDRSIVFLDQTDLARETRERDEAQRRRNDERMERMGRIRREHPIVVTAGRSIVDQLWQIHQSRVGWYRRGFATTAADGTLECCSETRNAIRAWGYALRDALPFETRVAHAPNYWSGGNDNGSDHIV